MHADKFEQKVWLVWNPARSAPTKMHSHRGDADQEARRLAAIHAGELFYVLEAVSAYRKVDVERVELREEVPF